MKYARWCSYLKGFAEAQKIVTCDDWTLEHIDAYKSFRDVSPLTWSKELEFLRQLFGWFKARKYVEENVAKAAKMPTAPKPADRVPYTSDEVASILHACDTYGRHPYERLRARAVILLMRHYGLRISDAATLRRDRVSGDQIMIRAQKNGAVIWAPLYPEVRRALDMLPVPKRARPDSPYFFWAGPQSSTPINFVKTVERSLKAVFDRSGVPNAHAHRFRHTLATELMVAGASVEDVANILGDDPDTIRRYYLKWSREYQERTTTLLDRVHGRKIEKQESVSLWQEPAKIGVKDRAN
jgi:integrase